MEACHPTEQAREDACLLAESLAWFAEAAAAVIAAGVSLNDVIRCRDGKVESLLVGDGYDDAVVRAVADMRITYAAIESALFWQGFAAAERKFRC